ncbi:phage-related protein [Fluviicoccus keumensis]|uniref:Phage-related protein n=1 Tax=Fluviicoccus keumensis TaxID=1435465 RepID=A0A4Q7YN14_9GAMM|nr:type II toxin-antitoxin system RelE/ParE family toxin [Fluviicoccus keumensis]RZU38233.1 phage-related protein [Fluviicoccus keumensis]
MSYTIDYYSDDVQAEILSLPPGVLADYLRLADLLEELGPAIRLPFSRAMGDGLFELRPHGREGIGRVFYCFLLGQRIVMLHSFIKKTQETPRKELPIAQSRLQEVKDADAR